MYIRSQYCIEHFIYHPIRDTQVKTPKLKIQADLSLVTNILLNRNDIRPTHFRPKGTLSSKKVQSMLITIKNIYKNLRKVRLIFSQSMCFREFFT